MKDGIVAGLTDPDPRRHPRQSADDITLHVNQQQVVLLHNLDFVCSVMSSMEIQDEGTINTFEDVCRYIGQLWQLYEIGNITPKLHLLTHHVPVLLRRFKRLGIFGEDPIERFHRVNNNSKRIFTAVKSYELRETQIERLKALKATPELSSASKRSRNKISRGSYAGKGCKVQKRSIKEEIF